jgi:hypothetical protein
MKFTGSDLADWIDKYAEDYWKQQDDFLINAHQIGNAHPVIVFGTWVSSAIGSAPVNLPLKAGLGAITEVLRLGNDLTFDSAGSVAKGVALNVLRVISVVQPATGYLKNQFRHRGLLALTKVAEITGTPIGPCQYTAYNNVVSFLKGKKVQYFADLADILRIRGINDGIKAKTLLEHPIIAGLLKGNGITWKPLPALKTIDDAISAARSSNGPIRFSIIWIREGEKVAHALMAIRDLKGIVRIIDYAEGVATAPGGMGFSSWAEFVAARLPYWGEGIKTAVLRVSASSLPTEFSSTYIRILHFADGRFTFAVPVAIGLKWVREGKKNFDDAAADIAQAMSSYFEKTLGSKAPPPPKSLYPSPTRPPEMAPLMFTHQVRGPRVEKYDWLSSIAERWYGDKLLWTVLFDHNKGPGFTDPNKINVGLRIKVPFITDKTPAELAAYRSRGLNWR